MFGDAGGVARPNRPCWVGRVLALVVELEDALAGGNGDGFQG